ncbi:MAG: multiheme c-type cytochrome [Pirellulaceae bacterium]
MQQAQDPHWELYSRTEFPSAQECAVCHQQIYDEWSTSSHAYAGVSPMFHVFEQKINDLSQGTVGYFCLRCHAPVATSMGFRRDQPIWDGPKVFREGVTCIACHRVKTTYTKANGERRIEPGDINAPVYGSSDGLGVEQTIKYKEFFKVLPNERTGTGQAIHRRAIQYEEIAESTFCASCHQVAVQPGIKLEVVWDQYRASPACREGTTCQDCHMGKVPGRAEGYSVGPTAIVNEKVINPERKHSNHMFYGPGYPIAHPGIFPITKEADRWHFNEWLLFDWQAGWGTEAFEKAVSSGQVQPYFPPIWSDPDDRMDAREIIDKNIKKIQYKKDIRRQVLENGSHLDGPFFTQDPVLGTPLKFYYCLTNTNNGHNMPSGSLGAQPQIWMNVVLIGPDGQRLWESGYLDSDGDLADNHSRDVLNDRVPLDKQLFNLQTKFLTTNVKGTDREMYLPVNLDIDQIPFLRPAPQPTTVINHPPFIRMEGHSLPPTANRKAKYVVPAELLQQPGTYRLSVRMQPLAPGLFHAFLWRHCRNDESHEPGNRRLSRSIRCL